MLAFLVTRDAARVEGGAAESTHRDRGVGGGAAGVARGLQLPQRARQLLQARIVHERHLALLDPVLAQEAVVDLELGVDQCIADGIDIELMTHAEAPWISISASVMAASVVSITELECAAETKVASNAEGAR